MRAPRVLILEENHDISLAMNVALERAGFEVATAPSPERALGLQNRLPADILIADVVLPLGQGVETIERFKQAFPGTRIVAMSRGGKRGAASPASGVGGADITLPMPFETATLLDTLVALVSDKPRITL